MEIMKIMMKSAPAIPPTFVFVDCYDTQNGTSNVVGRPPNFLMKNRGGAYSLCDAIFQVTNIVLGENRYFFVFADYVWYMRSFQYITSSIKIYNDTFSSFVMFYA